MRDFSNTYNVSVLSKSNDVYFIQYTVPVSTGVFRRTKCSYTQGKEFRDSNKSGLLEEIDSAIFIFNAAEKG